MDAYNEMEASSWKGNPVLAYCDFYTPAWYEFHRIYCKSSEAQLAQLQAVWAGSIITCPQGYAAALQQVSPTGHGNAHFAQAFLHGPWPHAPEPAPCLQISATCRDAFAAFATDSPGYKRMFDACVG